MVVVSADSALSAAATHVRIRVGEEQEDVVLDGRDITADADPVRAPLTPASSEVTEFVVTVELLRDEDGDGNLENASSLGVQQANGDYVEGEFREVWLAFDSDCSDAQCPAEFRCQQNRCVEYCVEAREPGETTGSAPIACGEPCTTLGCTDQQDLSCEDGYVIFEEACDFECNEAGDACLHLVPSNVEDLDLPSTLPAVVVSSIATFNTDFGTVSGLPIVVPHAVSTEANGLGCNGEPEEYLAFFVESLHIEEGGVLAANGRRPLIIVATGDITIDGAITVWSLDRFLVGPGGCGGIGTQGGGLGAGQQGQNAGTSWSGGAGGSFGGMGGAGGDGNMGNSGGVPSVPVGDPTLVPLVGGSSGGAGGGAVPVPRGGAGGGAIQLSTTGTIRLGANGVVLAGGAGGEAGSASASAGGGGSGGAILLEGRALVCDDVPELPVITAIGGGGGGASSNGVAGVVPEPIGGPGPPNGGNGSDATGDASAGQDGEFAAGGGGGAGRVRVNTLGNHEGDVIPCGTWLQPVSFGPLALE